MNILDVLNSPWAIMPGKMAEIKDIYTNYAASPTIDIEAMGKGDNNNRKPYDVINGVAIISIVGVLSKRASYFDFIFGGTSSEQMMSDIKTALADSSVESIILEIDSPGGVVHGNTDVAELIYNSRGVKPIVAFSDGLIASAAYWIGSAAEKVYISGKTVDAGSIGVVATHVEVSKAEEKYGIKTTEIVAGKYKRAASRYKALDEFGKNYLQEHVDHTYKVFVESVARNRGVSVDQALTNMADGRIFSGEQAIEAGLVDGITTLDELITAMSTGDVNMLSNNVPANSDRNINREPSANAADKPQEETAMELHEAATQMTVDLLKEHNPDLLKQITSQSAEEATVTATAKERERIVGVMAQGENAPGHDDIIKTAIEDGKSSGPDVAVKILASEKEQRSAKLKAMEKDAPKPVAQPSTDNLRSESDEEPDKNASIEDRCKAAWEKSADLKAEFGNSYDAFLAFSKADELGAVKILNGGK